MPAFNDLPYETLCDILYHLTSAELSQIAGLSRRLYDISQPLLYNAPFLPTAPVTLDSPVTSRELFLRTLLTPGGATLATHVRSLRVEWDRVESERATECLSDSLAVCRAAVSRLRLNYPLRRQGAQLMLIFDLLPRLHVLHIIPANGTYTYSPCSFARFLERAISPSGLPLALHSLEFFYCPPYRCPRLTNRNKGISGWTMLMLLQLPSIRTINVPTFSRRKISMHFQRTVAAPSHTTRLRFSDGDIPASALAFILRAPIALTHFSYTAARRGAFEYRAFWNALVPLRTSLRSLHVDFGRACVSCIGDWDRQSPGATGSLREWPALRTLSCALMMLVGADPSVEGVAVAVHLVDVLPEGIRELELLPDRYWQVGDVVEELTELLRRKGEVVPVLESVAVVSSAWRKGLVPTVELGGLCEVVGVKLVDGVSRW